MLTPALRYRIGLDRAVGNLVRFEQDREADDALLLVAHDAEHLRCVLPPRKHLCSGRSRLMTVHDRLNCEGVAGTRRLDREEMLGRREEGLAYNGMLDQVEHVGGVAPQLGRRRRGDVAAELPPRRRAVTAMRGRVGRAQGARDRLPDRVMDDESFLPELHEGKRS